MPDLSSSQQHTDTVPFWADTGFDSDLEKVTKLLQTAFFWDEEFPQKNASILFATHHDNRA